MIWHSFVFLLLLQFAAALLRVSPRSSEVSLVGARVSVHHRGQLAGKLSEPLPSSFFHGSEQEESTSHTEDESPRLDPPQTGYDAPLGHRLPKEFFEASPSAGAQQAWQTIWPSADHAPMNRQSHQGQWLYTLHGWSQAPVSSDASEERPGPPSASWFDSSVRKYNGMGQLRLPSPDSPERLMDALPGEGWVQRAVNTSLKCKEVNCTATSRLDIFDLEKEEARFCRLNIEVHPTDYDNQWAQEFIEFWKVNDHLASGQCFPLAKGCNAATQRPLIPCVQDLGVDLLLVDKGHLDIEGKLNRMVDECPYEGYLLNGVAMVTCMVRDIPTTTTTTTSTWASLAAEFPPVKVSGKLRCNSPGCSARVLIDIDPAIALAGGVCKLNLTVVQTDFDESVNVPEQIEYIFLEGAGNISTAVKPGRNPCTEELVTGKAVSAQDRLFAVISDRDVTAQIISPPIGVLLLRGKISEQVDECGSEGNLLDGLVTVECILPPDSKSLK
mmetsp:Transcript_58763/g.95110  ORF Transcript_58763/g.95110 Transcript_58763/m.95110 type:complete len:498 (-) Transcript_58763:9-1502(-)